MVTNERLRKLACEKTVTHVIFQLWLLSFYFTNIVPLNTVYPRLKVDFVLF